MSYPYKLEDLESIELNREDCDGNRVYTYGDQKFPSVTSVTSLHSRESIQKWRKRVGEKKANQISKKASNRGTSFHKLVENYLRGEDAEASNWLEDTLFHNCKSFLDSIKPYALEAQMFSNLLELAGTADCVADIHGRLCLIDFKTSNRPKSIEHTKGYFMQATAYAQMVFELTGEKIDDLVVMVAPDNHKVQIFIDKSENHMDDLMKYRVQYRFETGI